MSAAGIRHSLIFAHRWLGVALCLLFLTWFPSSLVMMYWDFPSVTAADRLERSPTLDSVSVQVVPIDAAAKAGIETPGQVRLNTFDGHPVYWLSDLCCGEGDQQGQCVTVADLCVASEISLTDQVFRALLGHRVRPKPIWSGKVSILQGESLGGIARESLGNARVPPSACRDFGTRAEMSAGASSARMRVC